MLLAIGIPVGAVVLVGVPIGALLLWKLRRSIKGINNPTMMTRVCLQCDLQDIYSMLHDTVIYTATKKTSASAVTCSGIRP